MRDDRRGNYGDREGREARWLHGHHQGQNSDRGNYTVDSHFNRGYGINQGDQYEDTTSFNSNAEQWQMHPQGRFQAGGAQYSGEDYARGSRGSDNPYGMSYVPDDDRNSGRHYDPQASYADRDYDDLRRRGRSDYRGGMADEGFGHQVRRGDNRGAWARGSRGDEESYRRYEQGNRNYDNDYSTGFSGRNYTPGEQHYGEGSHYSEIDSWQRHGDTDRHLRERDRR